MIEFAKGFTDCWWPSSVCRVNWDAWAGVAGVLAALGAVVIGLLAWRTAVKAKEIAERQQQLAEREAIQRSKVRGRLLLNEIAALHKYFVVKQNELHLVGVSKNGYTNSPNEIIFWLNSLQENVLPLSTAEIDNFHHFPESLGNDLATIIANMETLRVLAKKISDEGFDINLNGATYVSGDDSDFIKLSEFIHFMYGLTKQFGREFSEYVGVSVLGDDDPEYLGPIA